MDDNILYVSEIYAIAEYALWKIAARSAFRSRILYFHNYGDLISCMHVVGNPRTFITKINVRTVINEKVIHKLMNEGCF